jgi:hypothetical protein
MEIALAKFLLDALKELRDIFTKSKEQGENLVAVGTFLELYGSATRMEGYARRVRASRESNRPMSRVAPVLHEFFEELEHFGGLLKQANLTAVEVFHPELAMEVAKLTDSDETLLHGFKRLAPRFNIKPDDLERIHRLYEADIEIASLRLSPLYIDSADQRDGADAWETFEGLSQHLAEFRKLIAEVVRTTWDFKELATAQTKRKWFWAR